MKSAAMYTCAALALLAAAACGGSGKTDNTPSPASTPVAVTTVTNLAGPTPVAITDDARTAVAAEGAVEMVPYTDNGGRYTTKMPRGWTIDANKDTLITSLFIDPFGATIGIFCLPNATIDEIHQYDSRIMQAASAGVVPFGAAIPAQVGSLPAQAIYWQGNLGNIQLDRVFIYFEGNGCAWRIQMTAYPGVSLDSLKPILDAVTGSFAFTG